jgi:hypothetical protein
VGDGWRILGSVESKCQQMKNHCPRLFRSPSVAVRILNHPKGGFVDLPRVAT